MNEKKLDNGVIIFNLIQTVFLGITKKNCFLLIQKSDILNILVYANIIYYVGNNYTFVHLFNI